MNLFALIAISLATARIVRFLIVDKGPFNLFVKVREAAGIYEWVDKDGNDIRRVKDWFWGGLLDCHWCLGIWAAIIAFIIWRHFPPLIIVLGVAELAGIIEEILRKHLHDM